MRGGAQPAGALPGDHLCGVYRGPRERDRVVLPFLEAALRRGDKCICVIDAADPAEVIGALPPDLDARARADAKQLDVVRAADMYLRSGRFTWPEVIGVWKSAISEAMYDGRFDAVCGIETWSGHEVVPDMDELLTLESEFNRYLPLFPQVIVCLYDIERFDGAMVVNLLRTHRKVVMGGLVVENPYFLPPDEFLALTRTGQVGPMEEGLQEFAAGVAS
ncbi:MAG TPA: MEDS domain-containing protein [Acidimicrobiales bacterium]|nr:MEDS domain-containing protein [Acidimicrobiales bacterium]